MTKNAVDFVSIFNDVLGPVMRGPSSSHTAGSFHIGVMARSLMKNQVSSAVFTFDPDGSYARVYRQQGSDLAFAAGILGRRLTDENFFDTLEIAAQQGIDIKFKVAPLEEADHPNTVVIELDSHTGEKLRTTAKSIGGGLIIFTQLDDWQVELTGKAHETVVVCSPAAEMRVIELLTADGQALSKPGTRDQAGRKVALARRFSPLSPGAAEQIGRLPGVEYIWQSIPVYFAERGHTIFTSAREMTQFAQEKGCSLGRAALLYESQLLGLNPEAAIAEMIRRFAVMKESISSGLIDENVKMQLLSPTAGKISQMEAGGKLAVGGLHSRAAIKALAVMHSSNSMGIVCAAPTGGSAGTIPGAVAALVEEKKLSDEQAALALFAAGAIGLIIARRATFAAEVAGCQVEIGAAGAMAAAAVVEIAGGSAQSAADAAAIALQNTMGSVCDLVQGMCEIPCHTRNAAAAAGAYVCADLILGGYKNPIPLDETIDAVYSVGKMLPPELRCTALGGLAVTPSATRGLF